MAADEASEDRRYDGSNLRLKSVRLQFQGQDD